MRILIAEDDQVLADGLLRTLRASGAAADHVASGSEADAALLTNTEFDLLILDLGLPRMHGLEVLKRLRARGSSMPVLILTAADSVEERVKGLDYGADDYMAKPFDPVDLLGRLERVLRLPPADRKPRRAAILNRVRDGLPADYDLGQAPAVIDLTEDDDDARVGGGFLGRWRSRRGG